jgi:acid phosphatase
MTSHKTLVLVSLGLALSLTVIGTLLLVFPSLRPEFRFLKKLSSAQIAQPSPQPVDTTPVAEFVLLGDTGSGAPAQFAVGQAIAKYCSQSQLCQAAFIAGDIIYEKGVTSVDDPQFKTKFEDPYQSLNFPFYIAFGNHDYAGCPSCYIEYSSKSTKWRMPSSYYTQKFGEQIHFFVIDTEQFGEEQRAWLKNELATSAAQYKVVVGHRPLETYEVTKVGEYWNGKKELKEIVCDQADLYVAGHAHIMEDIGQLDGCQVRQLVTGGGGAYVRQVSEKFTGEFAAAQNGFVVLSVFSDKLSFTFYNEQGEVLHQASL